MSYLWIVWLLCAGHHAPCTLHANLIGPYNQTYDTVALERSVENQADFTAYKLVHGRGDAPPSDPFTLARHRLLNPQPYDEILK